MKHPHRIISLIRENRPISNVLVPTLQQVRESPAVLPRRRFESKQDSDGRVAVYSREWDKGENTKTITLSWGEESHKALKRNTRTWRWKTPKRVYRNGEWIYYRRENTQEFWARVISDKQTVKNKRVVLDYSKVDDWKKLRYFPTKKPRGVGMKIRKQIMLLFSKATSELDFKGGGIDDSIVDRLDLLDERGRTKKVSVNLPDFKIAVAELLLCRWKTKREEKDRPIGLVKNLLDRGEIHKLARLLPNRGQNAPKASKILEEISEMDSIGDQCDENFEKARKLCEELSESCWKSMITKLLEIRCLKMEYPSPIISGNISPDTVVQPDEDYPWPVKVRKEGQDRKKCPFCPSTAEREAYTLGEEEGEMCPCCGYVDDLIASKPIDLRFHV